MLEPFSSEAVARALRGFAIASVEVVERLDASSAEVARLRVTLSGGREPFTVIGKSAAGSGLAAARRELRFFAHVAPLWDSPAPALLGAWEEGHGADARLLLVTEDLAASGGRRGVRLGPLPVGLPVLPRHQPVPVGLPEQPPLVPQDGSAGRRAGRPLGAAQSAADDLNQIDIAAVRSVLPCR